MDGIELVKRYTCTRFGRWDWLLPEFTVSTIVYYLTDGNKGFLIYLYACLSKDLHSNTAKEAEEMEERKVLQLVIVVASDLWVS